MRSFKLLFSILVFLILNTLNSQVNPVLPTPAQERLTAQETRASLLENSLLKNIKVNNIGPTVFSGRVSDIDVNPKDPTKFYVAYASGGLWYTNNNGTTFESVFDSEDVLTIGDIYVDWKNERIWVGTGEVNSSRSSYAGTGIYLSEDWGKTWEHRGLPESHHIGRILVDPENKEMLYVAVLGHLYSPNPERGIYKSKDGGKNWELVLFVDENSGGIDLVLDPQNSNNIYAAIWERERRAWNFKESGPGSGIYYSNDKGETWSLSTTENSGFPRGDGVGRIGLDATVDNGETVVYAILDNYFRRPKEKEEKEEVLTKDMLRTMSKDEFIGLDEAKVKIFLKNNGFPKKYTYQKVKEMILSENIQPQAMVEYLEDANSLLFDTPVIEAEIYKYKASSKKWSKTHKDFLNGVHNSYGYYFAQIRCSQNDPNKIYVLGYPVLRSEDGGQTFININKTNVHVDHHAMWVNPEKEGHLINGNDGGINISYDDGENWIKCNSVPVGQFYYINVDMENPYNVYGGLQDNGVWKGSHTYEWSPSWHNSGKYPYQNLMGGDGMQIQIDSRDNTVYTGFQFGNYFRLEKGKGPRKYITPKHELGKRPYRWNWQAPILLSKHNEDIVYFGANKLLRSFDRGSSFSEISEDLTKGGIKGDVPYGTITTIDESEFRFGLLYVGTDDGRIHKTEDGGYSWDEITIGLPPNLWVSRVIASKHDENVVYAVLNGYRWDDFNPYLYMSEDKGNSWKDISAGLPIEPLNVIKEDPQDDRIIYVGSDHGLYFSTTRGENYQMLGNLPPVAVHDIVIHPRENHLVIGTHGRSLYTTDLSNFQQLIKSKNLDNEVIVFEINEIRYSDRWGTKSASYREPFEPEAEVPIYSKTDGEAILRVMMKEDETLLLSKPIQLNSGITTIQYDYSIDKDQKDTYLKLVNDKLEDGEMEYSFKETDNGKYYLKPGSYILSVTKNGNTSDQEIIIK